MEDDLLLEAEHESEGDASTATVPLGSEDNAFDDPLMDDDATDIDNGTLDRFSE